MPRIVCSAVLGALVLIGCERTPQPIAQTQQLTPQSVAVAPAALDSFAPPESAMVSQADSNPTRPSAVGESGASRNPEPPVPIHYKDVCPGEGCQFGEWLTCDTLRVLSEPNANAKTAFMLHHGDKFTAVTGDEILTQAGKVVFTRNVKIEQQDTVLQFSPADTLYPLGYDGEGLGLWYYRGKETDGVWFFGNAELEPADTRDTGSGWVVVRSIQSEWWVKVRANDGREGWMIPSKSIYGRSPHYEPLPAACPPSESR